MRKLIFITIVCAFLTVPVMAAPYDSGISVVDRNIGYYSGQGGEFTISSNTLSVFAYSDSPKQTRNVNPQNYVSAGVGYPADEAISTSFQSFCVERNEYIGPFPHMIEETWVNTEAVAGGYAGGSPDPLDARTAYLYTQFATGILSSYTYTPGVTRAADAAQLQQAIWYIENEISTLISGSQAETWVNEAQNAIDQKAWAGIGNVRILNLYDHSNLEFKQDMLYMVPVPAAVLLGMLGLSVAGIKLRKYA